jgi:glycosyltransferase involved in cell wall biosynthesis
MIIIYQNIGDFIRINLLTSVAPWVGGITTFSENLEKGLKKKGHDVKILSTNSIFGKITSPLRLRMFHDYDVVHTNYAHIVSYLVGLLKCSKSVLTIHGSDIEEIENNLIFKRFSEKSLYNNDIVVSNSKSLRERVIKILKNPPEIKVINHGIDTEEFKPKEKSSSEKIKLLTVSYLKYIKGTDILLKAFKEVEEQRDNVELTIAGDGATKTYYEMSKRLKIKNIKFLGWAQKNEIINLYQNSDIFILTSRKEGFGLTIIEAMSCALPVVATNVGGIPEILDKRTLCDLDTHQIAEKILHLIDNKKERKIIGMKNRKIVQERFNYERMTNEYVKLYKSLV